MNTRWKEKAFLDYTFFYNNIKNATDIQKEYLLNLLKRNQYTKFGKSHNFEKIKSIKDFQKHIPIRDYEDFNPWMDDLKNGSQEVLSSENVLLFEPTGGTSSGSKLIPYTHSLKMEFQKAINVWLMNIVEQMPEAMEGTNYWSISPVIQQKRKATGGIPIGFDNDYDYLGWSKEETDKVFVVPDEISKIRNINNFFYVTALFLLKAKVLSFISIWNPTFLTLLTGIIDNNMERLIKDINNGTLSLPESEDVLFLAQYLTQDKNRANEITQILEMNYEDRFIRIWPKLRIISCWADASAKYYINELKSLFKGVFIQAKGLLATEGIITIPLIEAKGAVPAYTSHFFEFLPDNDKTNPKLIHDLEKGVEYSVIITTGGGLYRYELKDKIQVTGKFKGLPVIKFIGRNETLDFVGEKLDETFVVNSINQLESLFKINYKFLLFAPEINNKTTNYSLYIECDNINDLIRNEAEIVLDKILCDNYHYKYARKINQLGHVKIYFIQYGLKKYTERCVTEGQRLGDIKPMVIDKRLDWKDYFLPLHISN